MSTTDLVSYWFAETIATGPISRDPAASAEAEAAKADLVSRLDTAKGAPADAVNAWFADRIACGGAIARNTVAYNQAFAAKDDLIQRLADAAEAASTPAKPAKAAKPADPPAAPGADPATATPA